MTLTTLRKRVEHYRDLVSNATNINTQQLEQLRGLPFYDWGSTTATTTTDNGNKIISGNFNYNSIICGTFNHAIGLPQKNGQSYPLFDYEQMLYDTLQKHRHVWIKKATGLGITEFILRYMAWLCFRGTTINDRNHAQIRNYPVVLL